MNVRNPLSGKCHAVLPRVPRIMKKNAKIGAFNVLFLARGTLDPMTFLEHFRPKIARGIHSLGETSTQRGS